MLCKYLDMTETMLLKQFLQIPYKHHGRSLTGADCYGGIILWYRMRLGIALLDIDEDYPDDWRFKGKQHFLENYHHQWAKVKTPGKYDVVLFNIGIDINHAGICLRNGKFYHICRAGGVIGRLDDPSWKNRIHGFYHFKGLEHEDSR